MFVKKRNGKVYGADFSAAERKAMEIEFRKEFAEFEEKHSTELISMVLWVLHEKFGFGHKRLKEFYNDFAPEINALIDRYQMEETDDIWLCTHMLKQYGVDLAKWDEEFKEVNEDENG